MAYAVDTAEASEPELDEDTGLPKAELKALIEVGRAQIARGEGIVMDDAAWARLFAKAKTGHPKP